MSTMINRVRVGDKFGYGYDPIIIIEVTNIEVMRSAATGDVTTLVDYEHNGHSCAVSDRRFLCLLDEMNACKMEEG